MERPSRDSNSARNAAQCVTSLHTVHKLDEFRPNNAASVTSVVKPVHRVQTTSTGAELTACACRIHVGSTGLAWREERAQSHGHDPARPP